MNTNDTNRQKAHAMIDHIFKDLLPAQGMAERSEQIKLSHRMLDTMLNGGIALCDAGTGIGKTYAYLVAAAAANRSDTEALRKPVIISTSSIALQNAVQTEYLPLLSCILLADGQIDRPLCDPQRKRSLCLRRTPAKAASSGELSKERPGSRRRPSHAEGNAGHGQCPPSQRV